MLLCKRQEADASNRARISEAHVLALATSGINCPCASLVGPGWHLQPSSCAYVDLLENDDSVRLIPRELIDFRSRDPVPLLE